MTRQQNLRSSNTGNVITLQKVKHVQQDVIEFLLRPEGMFANLLGSRNYVLYPHGAVGDSGTFDLSRIRKKTVIVSKSYANDYIKTLIGKFSDNINNVYFWLHGVSYVSKPIQPCLVYIIHFADVIYRIGLKWWSLVVTLYW